MHVHVHVCNSIPLINNTMCGKSVADHKTTIILGKSSFVASI